MFSIVTLVVMAIFLVGSFTLTAIISAFRRTHKQEAYKQLETIGNRFFYRPFHRIFFPTHEYEGLFFAAICTQHIVRFCFAATVLAFLAQTDWFYEVFDLSPTAIGDGWAWMLLGLSFLAFMCLAFLVGDYLPRVLGARYPERIWRICTPIASIFMLLVFPFIYLFLKVTQSISQASYLAPTHEPVGKQEIIEMIQQAYLSPSFDIHDRKLIESVVTFKERIAREVMVPRVDVFSLSADTPIKEAAKLLEREGYSRTPIYRNSVDNIVGVLMYKDILQKYMEYEQSGNDSKILQAPIETIQKSVLHTPETKKISSLLQDFRKRQVHLAIVVDEYGGTEGIVTIEDILEEIVGDIADEYDQEEELFYALPEGGWIVDARMNILDAEEALGIKLPQEGEYDTIGGYIYHTTGTIPARGFVIHHDMFDLEILDSNDRSVDRVRITPIKMQKLDRKV